MAAYEKLRCQVLAGKDFIQHFGLVLLLREGVVAWMSRCASSDGPPEPASDADPSAAAPEVPGEIRASVVQVLVSMVLHGPEETRA